MVLKRILVTALGALGLGALTAGPAFAQQVPAPSFFDNQVACSQANAMAAMNDPLVGTGTGKRGPSLLDQALRGATGMGDPAAITGGSTEETNLNFTIDATIANCGAGSTETALADTHANYQLALGYTQVLTQYQAVVREEANVRTAQTALNSAIENGQTGALLQTARDNLADAQADLARETARLSAIGGGAIYQAGIREWRAKDAVDAAIATWNMRVPAASGALTTLDAASYSRNVSLASGAQDLLDALTSTEGELVRTALGAYLGEGSSGATAGFTADGKQIIPMTTDGDLLEAAETVGTIRTRAMSAASAVAALEKAIADNVDENQSRRLNEGLRRARLEQQHLDNQLRRALNDNTDLMPDVEGTPETIGVQSIRSYNAAYQTALARRNAAEMALRNAVASRHTATMAVREAFQGPASYYEQYVARRQHLLDEANKDVADARVNGGTASKALTDAAAAAQRALTAAVEANQRYTSMVADSDNPAVGLINALLVPDDQKGDDDGQAVVDAVSGNFNAAKAAKTAADEAKMKADEVAESVMGLTGDEGAVSMNTQRSMQNETDIDMLDGRVTTNGENIATNTANIATNAGNIMTNTTHIMENRGMIETNAAGIMTNASGIMTNAGNIMDNSGRITANEGKISSNADAIAANMNSIGSNRTSIMNNMSMIEGLQDQMEIVRAGVAASMALAGMPAINGRGISIGVGSFDGESAFAVGFMIQGEMASFKVGVTSAGGETGASAGVGFQF